MVAGAGWWVAIVQLWPADSRPYIGGSQTNPFLELTYGYNGLGRLNGEETGSVGGGGRYDGLMAQIGGPDLSGIGYGLGVDRAVLALEAEGVELEEAAHRVDVFGIAIGDEARDRMSKLIDELRATGISADMAYGKRGLKGSMKGADRAGARFALVLGERELEAGEVAVKNLDAHSQESVELSAEAVKRAIGQ